MATKIMEWSLDIPIDLVLHAEVIEDELRFKTRYYGMKRGEFLILLMPGAPQIREHLFKRCGLVMRFMHAGKVYGFRTAVVAHVLAPSPIFFTEFPAKLEMINLRKYERVDTFLQARLQLKQEVQRGVILDISATGCRFTMERISGGQWSSIEPNTEVRLEFRLSDTDEPIRMPGSVASFSQDAKRATLGVKFSPGSRNLADQRLIDEYVQNVLQFSGKVG